MAEGELPFFAEKGLRIDRDRVARLWLKSWEAYGKLPKSTDLVFDPLQLAGLVIGSLLQSAFLSKLT